MCLTKTFLMPSEFTKRTLYQASQLLVWFSGPLYVVNGVILAILLSKNNASHHLEAACITGFCVAVACTVVGSLGMVWAIRRQRM